MFLQSTSHLLWESALRFGESCFSQYVFCFTFNSPLQVYLIIIRSRHVPACWVLAGFVVFIIR